ncbi:MAG: hypothetical protein MN733_26025 [Nitrososphaera sp.]|nr:hypothetical protein [Nitrososphaera sp.]
MSFDQTKENLAYHAARLLLLISFCGKPRVKPSGKLPGIEGRTLLAKLDFFLRYPAYLRRAAKVLGKEVSDEALGLVPNEEEHSVESRMVRYLYGPWDDIYYPALAYLIGKELIIVEIGRTNETFRLTPKGRDVANKLSRGPVYESLARRAETAYHLFNKYTGNRLKDFIYIYFPEVVNRELGARI